MPVSPAALSCAIASRHGVGVADERQPAHAVGLVIAQPLELLRPVGPGVMFFIARMLSTARQSALSTMEWRQYRSASRTVGRQVTTPTV